MKQIRSGQSFLYREGGYNSTVLEIRMKDPVTANHLEIAAGGAAKRFPYLTDKLVEKDGRYYLHPDHNGFNAHFSKKLRPLGSMATGYHLLDVTYTGNLIRVAFHHGLCDGRGVQPFVETLLYLYCREKYRCDFDRTGIRLPGEPIGPLETAEPFGKDPFPVAPDFQPPARTEGYPLPESTPDPAGCWMTEFLLDEKSFVKEAKAVGATPSIYASILLAEAVLDVHPYAGQPVVCNLAMDLRAAIGMDETHCNCVGSAQLPFTPESLRDLPALSARCRQTLKEWKQPDAVKSVLNAQIQLFNRLDEMKTLEERRQALSFFDRMVSNSFVISYLGGLRLNDYADKVESACFYSDTIKGLTLNILAAAGKMAFTLLQGFPGGEYAEALEKRLEGNGLLQVSGKGTVVTGRDMSYKTASRQAERWYAKTESK